MDAVNLLSVRFQPAAILLGKSVAARTGLEDISISCGILAMNTRTRRPSAATTRAFLIRLAVVRRADKPKTFFRRWFRNEVSAEGTRHLLTSGWAQRINRQSDDNLTFHTLRVFQLATNRHFRSNKNSLEFLGLFGL